MVIEGQGTMVIDCELVDIKRGDWVRVSPPVRRALKASADTALFVIGAGSVATGYPKDCNSRYLVDDGIPNDNDVPPWYQGNSEIVYRNAQLGGNSNGVAPKEPVRKSFNSSLAVRSTSPL